MRVQHNIPAMNSYRNYNNNAKSINKNLEKLSSGYRINRAGDDAAGLAISEKMRAQITGLEVAQKNAKDGISLVQTAEGALTEVHDMLNRMYALAEQSGNGTYDNSVDRVQLNKEVTKLREEINRIGQTTNFNGTKLFIGGEEATVSGAMSNVSASYTANSLVTALDVTVKAKLTTTGGPTQYQIETPSGWTISNNGTPSNAFMSITGGIAVQGSSTAKIKLSKAADTSVTPNVPAQSVELTVDFSSFEATTTEKSGTVKIPATSVTSSSNNKVTAQGNTAKEVTLSTAGIDLWVGDFPDSNNKINVQLGIISSGTLVIDSEHVNLESQQSALNSLSYIKDAIDYVSDMRGTLGAAQNRLEHTINNLSVMQENIQDAESTIRDTDVAEEMMKYTKNSILVQSAQAMLAQANQQPQSVLQLLQ